MPFKKGQSGNPAGLRNKNLDFKQVVRLAAADAFEVLKRCLTSDDERMRFDCAKWILERAHGKAPQALQLVDQEENEMPFTITVTIKEPSIQKEPKLEPIDITPKALTYVD